MPGLKDKSFIDGSILSDDFVRQLIGVGEADLLIGIPSLNNAKTIGHVVQAVEVGFAKYFPRERTVVINADAGSKDGTETAVRNVTFGDPHRLLMPQSLRTIHRVTTRCSASAGSAAALRTILAAAELVRAKACAIVSPDLMSIRPGWVDGLLRPIYKEEYDLLTPLYVRQKFDGLLISNLVYPMMRAAYGIRLREPVATEFAFSGKLASHLLEQGEAPRDGSSFASRIWMVTGAIAAGFRIGQCFLGPKEQASRDSKKDIVTVIRAVVGDLFSSLETQEALWLDKTGSQPAPAFGFPYDVMLEPVRVNRKRLLQLFRTGVAELESILKPILSPQTFEGLCAAADPANESFNFSDELWVKTIYDFAGAFHRSVINRDHIMQALVPLYRGRVASFTHKHSNADENQVESAIENLCLLYEQLKPYWIECWKLPR